jgi:hypothetical protein
MIYGIGACWILSSYIAYRFGMQSLLYYTHLEHPEMFEKIKNRLNERSKES